MPPNIPYSFVNEEDVMKRLNGNIALFNKLFAKFITTYRFADDDLRRLLAQGDCDGAKILAHSIKGTAANLGLVDFSKAAARVDRSISDRDETAIETALKAFSKMLGEIVKEVSES